MSVAHALFDAMVYSPVDTRSDFVELVVGRVGQGVDVGGQAGGGGGIDTGDMVVYAYLNITLAYFLPTIFVPRLFLLAIEMNYLFVGRFNRLLDKVDEIRRAKFAKC